MKLNLFKADSSIVLVKSDETHKFISKMIYDFLETLKVHPTVEHPKINYCFTCKKTIFDNQRFDHDLYKHDIEPAVGKMFTETNKYFAGLEKDFDERGLLP